jgi:hypothetical protein
MGNKISEESEENKIIIPEEKRTQYLILDNKK